MVLDVSYVCVCVSVGVRACVRVCVRVGAHAFMRVYVFESFMCVCVCWGGGGYGCVGGLVCGWRWGGRGGC